jgi:hypothetical protein
MGHGSAPAGEIRFCKLMQRPRGLNLALLKAEQLDMGVDQEKSAITALYLDRSLKIDCNG